MSKSDKYKFSFRFKFRFRTLIIILLLIIVGFLFLPQNFLKPVKNVFFLVTKPFSIAGQFSVDKISSFFDNLFHLGSLPKENKKLIKENLDLQSQLAIIKEVQHENEILKKELGFFNIRGSMKLVPTNIIGRPSSGYLKSIVIDRGSKDNVEKGQGVVSSGYLVGVVSEVRENSSDVTLITDYNSLVPVILQDSRATGLLRGGLGGLVIEDIPLNIPIKAGEEVVTSGLGGTMPSGILVGKTNKIVSKEGDIFQKITLETPINIYYLEFVFVVQN